jgi:hypothetical protein
MNKPVRPVRPKGRKWDQPPPVDVEQAFSAVRKRLQHFDMLMDAIRAAIDKDGQAASNFAEDYGMEDQLDPVRRVDVLRHALQIVGESS